MGPRNSLYQTVFFISPFVFPVLIGLMVPLYGLRGSLIILVSFCGATCVSYSKISEKIRGKTLISWGFSNMTKREKAVYLFGYFCIIGALLTEALLYFIV